MNVEFSSACRRVGVFLGASLLSGVCMAQDAGPKYTYVEGGYTNIELDDFDADGDLWGIGGSVALTDMLHLVANYNDGEVEDEIDVIDAFVGLGVNIALNETVDFVGQAGVVYTEVEFGPFDEDDQVLGVNAGLRAMLTPQFELNGGVSWVDTDLDTSDETAVNVGAVYSFTDMLAGTLGASFGDEVTSYGIGLRIYFN